MRTWFVPIVTGLAILALLIAIADTFFLRISVAEIYAGSPFVYGSHIGKMGRAPLAIVGLIIVSIWLLLRGAVLPLQLIRWSVVVLMMSACGLFSLVSPLAAIGQIAGHLDHQQTGDSRLNLFYQYSSIGTSDCDIVLVHCDRHGLICTYRDHWSTGSICLGNATPAFIVQTAQGNAIQLYNETHCCYGNQQD